MSEAEYVLGLDVGVSSVGWSVIGVASDGHPSSIVACGVGLFEAGTEGTMADIEKGQDEPRNAQRRMARLMRRQIWRRAKRKRKLLRALIAFGLLPMPEGDAAGDGGRSLRRPIDIDRYMKSIDARLADKWGTDHRQRQVWPYTLRASAALGQPLDIVEVGRALYHLAQRRGFLSNRRTDAKPKADEKPGEIKQAISDLQASIDALPAEPRTLGAYLAGLHPDQQRLRGRWTSRAMYQREFEMVWAAQSVLHPKLLTEVAREEIHEAIFYQRPLKNQSHLIGRCSLLSGERRAPIAHRVYQRFRVLQTSNAVEVSVPGVVVARLNPEQRSALTDALCREGDMTFAAVKKLLKLPKGTALNFEASKAKGLAYSQRSRRAQSSSEL